MFVYDIQDRSKSCVGAPTPANRDINLQIVPGEIVRLLGDNGASKSILIRQMVNLLRPAARQLRFLGHPLQADSRLVSMKRLMWN